MAIRRAKNHKTGMNNLTWGNFIKSFASGEALSHETNEKKITESIKPKVKAKAKAKKEKTK